jgi:multidrug transporter EmrE-like cation transporter
MTALQPLLHAAILASYVVLSLAGLTLYKSSASILTAHGVAGLALYGLGFVLWMAVILRALPLSVAFPLAAGALIIGSQVSGWLFLKEPFSAAQLTGGALMVVGLGLVYSSAPR